jgi:signal peptidase I
MGKLSRFLLWMLVLVGAFVALARVTAIRWWRIPNDDPYLDASIAPTLRGGDLIVLWRLTKPHSGDLVLCPEPKQPERVVIGRIAAVAGESIEISGSSLRVNARRVPAQGNCRVERFTVSDPQTNIPLEQRCVHEELGTRVHERGDAQGEPPPKVTATVEPGQVFLVSDNRQIPYDSRDFGSVERNTCKETVLFRLVSAAGFTDVDRRLSLIR